MSESHHPPERSPTGRYRIEREIGEGGATVYLAFASCHDVPGAMPSETRQSFWSELKRRRVVRVGVTYAVASVGVGGAADIFLPGLGAPPWALQTVLALLVLGLPVAVALSWPYDITPQGIVRDSSASAREPAGPLSMEQAPVDVSGSDDRNSIVVLPFDNMSPDPGDAYFSDGLTEEIITQLSYLRSLRVISRSSAMVLKETQKDVRTIGRELDVGYVLEGSVRKAGKDLRITAQLIDASADEYLWTQSYDRELRDVFDIQSEIALSVASGGPELGNPDW